MNRFNFALKRYCREIRSQLPCSRKIKNRIMDQIVLSIDEYLSENPSASIDQIVTHFGTPLAIASAYTENLNNEYILRKLHNRKTITQIIATAALFMVLSWSAFLAIELSTSLMSAYGYIVVDIID